MYKLQLKYHTGDSETSYIKTEILELGNKVLFMSEENFRRIVELDKWYYKNEACWYRESIDPPVFGDENSIILLTDDIKPYKIYPYWCGYHEELISIEIISDNIFFNIKKLFTKKYKYVI